MGDEARQHDKVCTDRRQICTHKHHVINRNGTVKIETTASNGVSRAIFYTQQTGTKALSRTLEKIVTGYPDPS